MVNPRVTATLIFIIIREGSELISIIDTNLNLTKYKAATRGLRMSKTRTIFIRSEQTELLLMIIFIA